MAPKTTKNREKCGRGGWYGGQHTVQKGWGRENDFKTKLQGARPATPSGRFARREELIGF